MSSASTIARCRSTSGEPDRGRTSARTLRHASQAIARATRLVGSADVAVRVTRTLRGLRRALGRALGDVRRLAMCLVYGRRNDPKILAKDAAEMRRAGKTP